MKEADFAFITLGTAFVSKRMVKTYCDESTSATIKGIEKFMKAAKHRIENMDCAKTAEFARQQLAKADDLEKQIPGLDLDIEKRYFNRLV